LLNNLETAIHEGNDVPAEPIFTQELTVHCTGVSASSLENGPIEKNLQFLFQNGEVRIDKCPSELPLAIMDDSVRLDLAHLIKPIFLPTISQIESLELTNSTGSNPKKVSLPPTSIELDSSIVEETFDASLTQLLLPSLSIIDEDLLERMRRFSFDQWQHLLKKPLVLYSREDRRMEHLWKSLSVRQWHLLLQQVKSKALGDALFEILPKIIDQFALENQILIYEHQLPDTLLGLVHCLLSYSSLLEQPAKIIRNRLTESNLPLVYLQQQQQQQQQPEQQQEDKEKEEQCLSSLVSMLLQRKVIVTIGELYLRSGISQERLSMNP